MGSISKLTIKDRMRLARTADRRLADPFHYTTAQWIAAAEEALQEFPNEWIVYYALGDHYQMAGRYGDALRVIWRCVELRPRDIRATYALATGYNLLTRAAWSPKESRMVFNMMGAREIIPSPDAVKGMLDEIGLSIDMAALQAVRWFERSLSLRPDVSSRTQITQDLETLHKRFPQLGQ